MSEVYNWQLGREMAYPYEAHFRREPCSKEGVHVRVVSVDAPARADAIASGLVELLRARGRKADAEVILADKWFGLPHADALRVETEHGLVLVTSATAPWTDGHLDPLLKAIDHCDHVFGCRRLPLMGRLMRRLARLPWKFFFAVPIADVHSPCRLHRRAALVQVPLQARSEFADVELLAKATFLGHLIDEADVPPLDHVRLGRWWHDFVVVLKRPIFQREAPSSPAEKTQGKEERDDRPGAEDGQRGSDFEKAGPVNQDQPVRCDQLREGQGLDDRLDRLGEPLGREEDPRAQPHGHHDEVHEAAHGLGALGAAGNQQAEPGEGQGADDLHQGE